MKFSQSSFKLRSAGLLFGAIVCLAMQRGVIGLLSVAGNEETSPGLSLVPDFKVAGVVNRRLKTAAEAIKAIMETFQATNFGMKTQSCQPQVAQINTPSFCFSDYFIPNQQVKILFSGKGNSLEVLISTKKHHNNPLAVDTTPHPYEFAIKLTFDIGDDNKFNGMLHEFGLAINSKTAELVTKQNPNDLELMCSKLQTTLKSVIATGEINKWGNLCIWLWPNNLEVNNSALMRVQIQDTDYLRLSIQVGSSHFSMKIPRKNQATIDGIDIPWDQKVLNAVTAWLKSIELQPNAARVSITTAGKKIGDALKIQTQSKCYIFDEININKESYFTAKPKQKNSNGSVECGMSANNEYEDLGELSVVYIQHDFGLLTYGQLYMDSRAETVEYLLDLNPDSFSASIQTEIKQFFLDNRIALGKDEILTQEIVLKALEPCGAGCPPAKDEVGQGNNNGSKITISCQKKDSKLISVGEVTEGVDQSIRIRFMYPKSLSPVTMPPTGLPNQLILAKFNSYDQKKSIADACAAYATFAKSFPV